MSQHLKGRKSDGLAEAEDEESQEEEVRGKNAKARPQTQMFSEIEVNQASKERQRSSELGISNKYHRRLQTSMIGKHVQMGEMAPSGAEHGR